MSNHIDNIYKKMVNDILETGERRSNRTGVDTISTFGYQFKVDLREGFPLLTTKKVLFSSVVKELLWFLSGSSNIKDLGCGIWDAWADEDGNVGKSYGYQMTKWDKFKILNKDYAGKNKHLVEQTHINQIQEAIDQIKTNPDSRRIVVSNWNPANLDETCLAYCHALFQFNVSGQFLDLQLYQRSADTALGVPFNIASYALLLSMVAKECNLVPRYFVHTFGDLHIYVNHIEGLKKQIDREPYKLPELRIADKPFWEIKEEDITLENYQHHSFIKFPVAV